MKERWLTWAIDDPAPGNCGYSALNVPCELADPSLRRGETVHSVWGYFIGVKPSEVMASLGNSWGVTIMRSGQVWKHRPRPTFVNWHAGGPAQNIGTDGIEMEGKDEPWTPQQKASLLRVLKETWEWFGWTAVTLGQPTDRTQESIRQALLAGGYGSLWEHNWFDNTSCPMGRNEWGWLVPELTMALAEEGNAVWSNWENLGRPAGVALKETPSAVSWAEGRLDVFAVGRDGQVYHRWYIRGKGWSNWENLGGESGSGVASASWAAGRLDTFTIKRGSLRHRSYER